jgi:hypothetical protein
MARRQTDVTYLKTRFDAPHFPHVAGLALITRQFFASFARRSMASRIGFVTFCGQSDTESQSRIRHPAKHTAVTEIRVASSPAPGHLSLRKKYA